jgi:hypothetical protein
MLLAQHVFEPTSSRVAPGSKVIVSKTCSIAAPWANQ